VSEARTAYNSYAAIPVRVPLGQMPGMAFLHIGVHPSFSTKLPRIGESSNDSFFPFATLKPGREQEIKFNCSRGR
jgi:hypothetical protein